MYRQTRASLHLFADTVGSHELPFDGAQQQRVENRLATLFTPPNSLLHNDSFRFTFSFESQTLPSVSFEKRDDALLGDLASLGPGNPGNGIAEFKLDSVP